MITLIRNINGAVIILLLCIKLFISCTQDLSDYNITKNDEKLVMNNDIATWSAHEDVIVMLLNSDRVVCFDTSGNVHHSFKQDVDVFNEILFLPDIDSYALIRNKHVPNITFRLKPMIQWFSTLMGVESEIQIRRIASGSKTFEYSYKGNSRTLDVSQKGNFIAMINEYYENVYFNLISVKDTSVIYSDKIGNYAGNILFDSNIVYILDENVVMRYEVFNNKKVNRLADLRLQCGRDNYFDIYNASNDKKAFDFYTLNYKDTVLGPYNFHLDSLAYNAERVFSKHSQEMVKTRYYTQDHNILFVAGDLWGLYDFSNRKLKLFDILEYICADNAVFSHHFYGDRWLVQPRYKGAPSKVLFFINLNECNNIMVEN